MSLLIDGDYYWEAKSTYLWIIDCGHGGMKNGKYTTAPAKMHKFPEFTIYEGVINRLIGQKVVESLRASRIDYAVVSDPIEDNSLESRVRTADNVYAKDKRSIYLSIHSNAGGGSGFEVFTSPGQTKSDKIADIFCKGYASSFPDFKLRRDLSDGDGDKEADFYVLRKTDCPAILVENLFFDNETEAKFLLSSIGQTKIAKCITDSIIECEKMKPI